MNSKKFFQWCRDAVSGIKYRPDRDEVHRELYQHLEDRYETYISHGFNEKEAEERSLQAMGSAEEIAPQLSAIHNSFLPYVLVFSRCILVLLVAITVIPFFQYIFQIDFSKTTFDEFYPFSDYDPYTDSEYQSDLLEGKRVLYLEPDSSAHSDGYTVTVTRAALWRYENSDGNEKENLYISVKVSNPRLWAESTQIISFFCADDNLGNHYYNRYEAGYSYDACFSGNVRRTGIFAYTFEMYLSDFISDGVQWIELNYDRDGRNIALRIDLTGGVASEQT